MRTDRFDGSPELPAYRVLTQLGLGASAQPAAAVAYQCVGQPMLHPNDAASRVRTLIPTDQLDGSLELDLAAYRVLTQLGLGASA